ncbi:hypothetical protein ACFS4T_20865 [Pseudomonas lini]
MSYLKEKYPEVFKALDEVDIQEVDEDGIDSADDPAFLSQLFDHAAARNAKMIDLSRKEVSELTDGGSPPGTSPRLPGASIS